MKLWIDDLRPAPEGYIWLKSVNEAVNAIKSIQMYEDGQLDELDFDLLDDYTPGPHLLDLDHDAGDYAIYGGDYIKVLDYLEASNHWGLMMNFIIHIHTGNTVGRQNMMAICQKNGWTVIA